MNIKEKFQRKINQVRCARIFHKNRIKSTINKGVLTIYHDYERQYHKESVISFSDKGILKILEIENKFKINSTFNIVSKLIWDVPLIVEKIKADGHDIACHSYSHSIMTKLRREQVKYDIELSKSVFSKNYLKLSGLRCPQSKWNFKMLPIILDCGLKWSAENDRADYPYTIYQKKNKKLLRMPIKMDDWEYEERRITPNEMFCKLIRCVDNIAQKKTYGALGFHPWVQGKKEERIKVFQDFINYVARNKKIIILTFDQAFGLFEKNF